MVNRQAGVLAFPERPDLQGLNILVIRDKTIIQGSHVSCYVGMYVFMHVYIMGVYYPHLDQVRTSSWIERPRAIRYACGFRRIIPEMFIAAVCGIR